jgi:predicted metal-dependent phosphoesterase TrpH
MKFADLHLHTLFSDGTFSPGELVAEAKAAGLSAIAVCDHDTVEGIPLCIEEGKKVGIEVIPAIELTSEYEGLEIHVLGYFLDYTRLHLVRKLESLRKYRIERVYKITGKLKAQGVDLDPAKVFAIAREGVVGRLHIARALFNEGFVSSTQEAFYKYIGDKCPSYVAGFRFTPKEALNLIKDSGGVPVLAHPYLIRNDEYIQKFINDGIMGLEVYYPEHSQSDVNYFLNLAREHNLLVTGGSDCHGKAKAEIRIGAIKLPYELVEKIKSACPKIK